ncbi:MULTISPECIES: cysteine desulfurase [Sphingobium]|jgi:cysteine desulfurase / selenocysteine lyase|uniref:cysteine desulfurase n=1 Tax=Sphingobium TaxID=165695 RepID=UPI000C41E212|nr:MULTISPECIES: cysteine desulfurase [Sphingobium]MBS50317.1 cysteine desulfurase [Sphingobium sp.]MCC4256550.1 cysteine desulfurase [Sphingobium lactosutens]MEC9018038.1 cysteine desulfurase [Pseudomonadota bacterium]MEE2741010.1 cysteine desulfurase [Pseudomonadota bacterium]|tara:strand:- start:2071 stop:3276 length:1206 start_codon:yes stop_codon:yes gene_type:complete
MTDLAQGLRLRDDFPGVGDWHYLDSAATAQKPQAVIDAIARAYGADYATVHRGVYERSANMTLAYEAARRKVAQFIGAASDAEIVYVRGATEGINLVAQSWAGTQLKAGDRILLSTLEHHSNIVPWQIVAERVGAQIDVVPLMRDGCIDLDAMAAMITPAHKMVALAHVSNVLGSVLDCRRAADIAHGAGAKILIDGCQAVPRLAVNVAALDCDFYVFSAHKLYGPTGIGVLWVRQDLLDAMPPYQGGGSMIDKVTFEKTTYAPAPTRFEAGTPHITGVVGLSAAIDYVQAIGLETIHAHECALVAKARSALDDLNSVRLFGPESSAGILSFEVQGVHPHDVGTILDEGGVAIRAGHHCAQPLMRHLGVEATARASFGLYSDDGDVDALVQGLARVRKIFG